jgi:hypothetical protein
MTKLKLIFFSLLCLVSISLSAQNSSDLQPRPLRFAWGANLAGGIELSGHNMSTMGINGEFGLQYRWVRFFGASAEANFTVGTSSRIYPLSVVFRTDFSNTRKLVFLDLRGGLALVYKDNEGQQSQPYGSAGIGVTLANGKNFASHLIIGYTYVGQDECMRGERRLDCPGISYASMRLGLSF